MRAIPLPSKHEAPDVVDLVLSDEQVMLRDSAARFVRAFGRTAGPQEIWRQFAELGWLALPIPEDHGGLGGCAVDTAVLLEELGRGPLITPYIGTLILCGGLIATLGNDVQKAGLLPDMAAGLKKLSFAHDEPGPRGGPASLQTHAEVTDEGWRLRGTKIAVIDALDAAAFIVSARLEGRTALFLVPRTVAGLSCAGYTMLGGGSGATLRLDGVLVGPDDCLTTGDATTAIEAATDSAIIALCAEAVGMMAALLDATVDYSNTRQQFGKSLSANQSVRFKLADMAVALEEARSMSLRASLSENGPEAGRVRAVAGAKAGIGRRARLVAELAIQLHGGMGVTEELPIGIYYKRVLAFDAMFGGGDSQLARHARASGRLQAPRARP